MRKGLALIVVVGVLGVLAVAFVTMAQLERKASQQRVNAAKAYLLARSGLEDALARLALGQDPAYGGENWDGSAGALLSGYEAAQEAYRRTGIGTKADVEACPAKHAMRPSFFRAGLGGTPAPVSVEGRDRGYSGLLAGDRDPLGNGYALKVVERGGIHVNGGDLTSAGEHPGTYDPTLKRILGNLAEELGSPLLRADGEALVVQRPSGGWWSLDQIQTLALGGDSAKLEAFRPYLALNAWVDRKVIRPTALPTLVGVYPRAWAEIKKGSSDDPGFSGGRSGSPAGVPVCEPRAPISLAWARDKRPVVAALVRDLQGLWLDEEKGANWEWGASPDCIGRVASVTLSSGEAHLVADRLAAWTSDLGSWQAFHAFCDSLDSSVLTGSSDEVQAKRDVLKANFNPNTDLNKFNPNPSLWKSVDKGDLLVYSTEFSLLPSLSREISSAARILGAEGRLLAQRTLSLTVSSALISLTAQSEFVAGDLGALDVAGDEPAGSRRTPGAPLFVTESQGIERTWGHRLSNLGQYPGTWLDGVSGGAGLQSYPEPCVAAGLGTLGIVPATYDGNLQLATVETPDDLLYGVTASTQDMKCLARFDNDFGLDLYDSTAPLAGLMVADSQTVPSLNLSALNNVSHKPNTLYPDGCYSERNRTPAFLDRGNANGFNGLVSFWVKPNLNARDTFARGHTYVQWTSYGGAVPGAQDTEFFSMGTLSEGVPPFTQFAMQYETSHTGADTGETSCLVPARASIPRRWHLVSFFYNFRGITYPDAIGLRIDAGLAPDDVGNGGSYYSQGPMGALPHDLTADAPREVSGAVVPHTFALGRRWCPGWGYSLDDPFARDCCGTGADATFDEFAIWDFGQDSSSLAVLASKRFKEGRYYKGSAYTNLLDANTAPAPDQAAAWFSAPIALPPGSRIERLRWTWYRPGTLPGDYAEIELVEPDGASYLGGDEASSRSTKSSGWSVDRQSWDVNRTLPGPFRIHAVFRRTTPLPLDTPILDSPVLDDLAIVYSPSGGPRILAWREGE